ncbi:inosineuridine preferring nucleoside hydrolase family protein [Acanthamoeba castellanii str. Neff]|uniref:Inosineuridine preferring nucleoside hydrolase family protein n=1 Tax=Acanthamoeba castellanii (strain ATCC 30010 / Neff) TaxID=1257118 RepID=L8GG65_ACACF|nr:inosineuridine preferring nucleoside hydrolase family protein [Acanthamoeba castellanii str. Neff]ELR12065.1 inosineuridine preferring nucleoside hydrolase family protein [Acanthamoeba castellanii str. Neff]
MTASKSFIVVVAMLCLMATVALAHRPSPSPSPSPKPTVFVFTDVNTDDFMALKLILKYSNVKVGGFVAGCAGFCNMGPGIQNLFGLLKFMDRDDVPVWAGEAYASTEIDSGNYSCTFQKTRNYYPGFPQVYEPLRAAIAALDGPVEFLSLGTLTEIDYLFRRYPDLKQRVRRITIMGGAVHVPGNLFFPRGSAPNTVAECNIYLDPHSARNVFVSGVPIRLVPLDATNAFQLSWEFLNEFDDVARTKEAKFVKDLLILIKNNSAATSMYSLWDPLTAAILADHSIIFEEETVNMTVVTSGSQAGRTVIDNVEGKPVQVVLTADPDFYDIFIDKLNRRRRW